MKSMRGQGFISFTITLLMLMVALLVIISIIGMIASPSDSNRIEYAQKAETEFEAWLITKGINPFTHHNLPKKERYSFTTIVPIDHIRRTLPDSTYENRSLTRYFYLISHASKKYTDTPQADLPYINTIFALYFSDTYSDSSTGYIKHSQTVLELFRTGYGAYSGDYAKQIFENKNKFVASPQTIQKLNIAVKLALLGQTLREMNNKGLVTPVYITLYNELNATDTLLDIQTRLHELLLKAGVTEQELAFVLKRYELSINERGHG